MFFVVIFLCILAVIGGSVVAGLFFSKRTAGHAGHAPTPPGRGRKLSNKEKLDLAKVAGVMPSRKEN
ncbi:MAG: hypothetical protein ABUS57_05490 [Pseudomonadota bacterium]